MGLNPIFPQAVDQSAGLCKQSSGAGCKSLAQLMRRLLGGNTHRNMGQGLGYSLRKGLQTVIDSVPKSTTEDVVAESAQMKNSEKKWNKMGVFLTNGQLLHLDIYASEKLATSYE